MMARDTRTVGTVGAPVVPLATLVHWRRRFAFARYGGSLTSYAKREAYAAKRLYLMPTTQQ